MIRASQILFWFGLSIAASLALYHTSDRTRELDHQLRDIDAAIEGERESIHVLNAEWVYLANPARVEAETKKHLALRPTAPKQVIALADLDDALPTRAQAMESVAVSSTPIASVEASAIPEPPPMPARKIAAAADRGHINNRMAIGNKPTRTASAAAHDQIGTLINQLGTHP
jgi:hypothetical protein